MELGFLGCLAVLVAAAEVAGGRFDFVVSTRPVSFFDQTCAPDPGQASACRLEGAWTHRPAGWFLEPGQSGELTTWVDATPAGPFFSTTPDRDPDTRLTIALSGTLPASGRARLSLWRDGAPTALFVKEVAFDGRRVDVTPFQERLDGLMIRLEVAAGPSPVMLTKLRLSAAKPPRPVPNVAIAALLLLTPLLAYRVRLGGGADKALIFALAVLAGQTLLLELIVRSWTQAEDPLRWWELVTDGRERDLYLFLPYLMLVALLAWRQWAAGTGPPTLPTGPVLVGIFLWGLSRRIVALAQAMDMRLDSDVVSYMQIAQSMTSLYDTQHREPMWIWLTRLWLDLTGWGALQMRLLSLVLSFLMIALAYKLFRDYTGRPALGALVAFLLCVNPYLIRLSVRGLREEAYSSAVLVLAYFVLVPAPKLALRAQAWWMAVAGAAAQLMRFNSHTFIVPLILVWGWRQAARQWRYVALPLLLILAVSLPHVAYNYKTYGDPMYSVNLHFRWFRNLEFVVTKGLPCEGCPDRDQYHVTPYAGPPVTGFQYMFGMHSLGEILDTTLQGYTKMYLAPTEWFEVQTGTKSYGAYAFYLLGFALVLAGPYREILLWIVVLANFLPYLAVYNIEPRVSAYTIPFATFLLAYGIWWAGRQALRQGLRLLPDEPVGLSGIGAPRTSS